VLAFLVPYVASSLLELQHDVYLVIFTAFVAALLATYARATHLDVRALLSRKVITSVAIGVALLALLIVQVAGEKSSPHPSGAYFVFELIWRGGVYGAADALLLTAFPCAVVYSAMRGRLSGWRRRTGYVAASFAAVMLITATYHLGYSHFRQHDLNKAEFGNVVMSIPAVAAAANPVGSIIAHSGMHIAAVVHDYETESRLPPHASAK
jgi:hypothetical protein